MQTATPFYVNAHEKIHSLRELIELLERMDSDCYKEFVNKDKNDFSAWIRDCFYLPKLAQEIRYRDKESTMYILESFLHKEKQEEKSEQTQDPLSARLQNMQQEISKAQQLEQQKQLQPESVIIEDSISNTSKHVRLGVIDEDEEDDLARIEKRLRQETKHLEKDHSQIISQDTDAAIMQKELHLRRKELQNMQHNLHRLQEENKELTKEYLFLKEKESGLESIQRVAHQKLHKAAHILQTIKQKLSQINFSEDDKKWAARTKEEIEEESSHIAKEIRNSRIYTQDIPLDNTRIGNIEQESEDAWDDIRRLEEEIERLGQ